jgi:hypothetical protein
MKYTHQKGTCETKNIVTSRVCNIYIEYAWSFHQYHHKKYYSSTSQKSYPRKEIYIVIVIVIVIYFKFQLIQYYRSRI